MLQNLGSDHLPILLSIPLSPAYHPNERPSSFNFQKARWGDFVSYFDSNCRSAEEYSSLSLSSAAALFTSLALNAAKSSIPFGRIKRPPKTRWSAEVEEAVSKRRKAFAAAHRSDEDRQAYISERPPKARWSAEVEEAVSKRRKAFAAAHSDEDRQAYISASRRASSVIAKAKAEAWQTTCSSLSPRSNPKSVHSLLCSIAGSPSSSSSLFLTFPTVLLPGNRLQSMPLTCDPTFPFLNQRPCVAEPEATSLSSAEPRALRSLIRPFALLSLPLNFLRLPPTSPRPLQLAQTKLPISC